MVRFQPWVFPICRSGPVLESAFDEVDRYFFALRLGSVVAVAVWAWKLVAPGAAPSGVALASFFVLYSAVLYLHVWRRPEARACAYLAVLPGDLIVLFLVCLWSAQPMSAVYLAAYLLVALHAFYFGLGIGVAAAGGVAASYTALFLLIPPAERCSAEELGLRLGFVFLVAVSLGLVSRQLRAHRQQLFEANRQLQQRNRVLEQAYRHLSIGRLAGDVAHNINNPVSAIVSGVGLMRRRAQKDGLPEAYLQDLATVADQALRIGSVVRSLVALSEHRKGEPQSLDLARVAEGVALLFESPMAEKNVRLERRLVSGLRVRGAESALRQVVVNLLSNALDAVKPGGEIVIETRSGAEPNMVELRVRDNGHGISAVHLDNIFNPFFTTKDGATGVGLGLSLSLAVVRRLGGTIAVDSSLGKGSIFTLALPADLGSEAEKGK